MKTYIVLSLLWLVSGGLHQASTENEGAAILLGIFDIVIAAMLAACLLMLLARGWSV